MNECICETANNPRCPLHGYGEAECEKCHQPCEVAIKTWVQGVGSTRGRTTVSVCCQAPVVWTKEED